MFISYYYNIGGYSIIYGWAINGIPETSLILLDVLFTFADY